MGDMDNATLLLHQKYNFSYAYFYEGDLEQLRKPWVREPHFIPMVVVYSITFVLGLFGNIVVIAVMCCGHGAKCVTFPCLLSMAWADVLFLLVCVPAEVGRHFIGHWELSNFLCKLSGFVEMMSATATVFNLILISAERYFAIAHPLTSKIICTKKYTKIALVTTWIGAILLSSPSFIVMDTETNLYYNNASSVAVTLCGDAGIPDSGRLPYAVFQLCLLFAIPAIIVVFCYSRVIWILWHSTKQLQYMASTQKCTSQRNGVTRENGQWSRSLNDSSASNPLRGGSSNGKQHLDPALQSRQQVIKMLVVIITVFLVSWGPKLVFHVLKKYRIFSFYSSGVFVAIVVFNLLPYVQSSLNPVIYIIMSKSIRKSICKSLPTPLIKLCSRCGRDSPNSMMMMNSTMPPTQTLKTTMDTCRMYGAGGQTADL
ncbi:cholecystokinin receptor type A [Patella vulgata]|uniref:cholecystokinin receptor type A n=1 Tax=Patella vulgata TaxID=6465 RepID=UPI0021808F09|nr:cholecystokinin receptor type A [Patella vulgata]